MIILSDAAQLQDPGIETPPPENLSVSRLPWAQISFRQYPFGDSLVQCYRHAHFDLCYRVGNIKPDTVLYTYLAEPTITLHFMLEGESIYHLPGMPPHQYVAGYWQMNYIPAGKHAVRLSTGRYQSLYVSFKNIYLQELAETSEDIASLYRRLQSRDTAGKVLSSTYIDAPVIETVSAILSAQVTVKDVPLEIKPHISSLNG